MYESQAHSLWFSMNFGKASFVGISWANQLAARRLSCAACASMSGTPRACLAAVAQAVVLLSAHRASRSYVRQEDAAQCAVQLACLLMP